MAAGDIYEVVLSTRQEENDDGEEVTVERVAALKKLKVAQIEAAVKASRKSEVFDWTFVQNALMRSLVEVDGVEVDYRTLKAEGFDAYVEADEMTRLREAYQEVHAPQGNLVIRKRT